MSIARFYAAEVRTNLDEFPVWEPGQPVAVGEVGILKRGIFVRETTLDALGIPTNSKTNPLVGPRHFHSKSIETTNAGIAAGETKLRVDFKRSGAVVFAASDLDETRMDNLQQVRPLVEAKRAAGEWPLGWVFISSVWSAKHLAVLVSTSNQASLELKGDSDLLQQLMISDAGVKLGESKDVGFMTRTSGPTLIRLYGFDWLHRAKARRKFAPGGRHELRQAMDLSPKDASIDDLQTPDDVFDGSVSRTPSIPWTRDY